MTVTSGLLQNLEALGVVIKDPEAQPDPNYGFPGWGIVR